MVKTEMSLSLTLLFFLVVSTSALRNVSSAENKGPWCVASDICFEPNTIRDHASFVMNLYYYNLSHTKEQFNFNGN
ncbi:hypothetical protein EUTSA_v10005516mg [Eutrema salsugineum]|uniref:X8 domain-containing protein n=1 Tax=Eutrema salsugineum TaxID=72664 RepID=V4KW29_EUTSA|nr:hypothetical protein EUTSA_v10005516mg [Eutrema salsugineum]